MDPTVGTLGAYAHAQEAERSASRALAVVARTGDRPSLDLVIAAWLDAKAKRTGSEKTARAYRDALTSFRAMLTAAGCDLDTEDARKVGLLAQAFAGRSRSRDGEPVSAATFNQRLAILSSFYAFAWKRTLLPAAVGNPIASLDRRPVESYAGAHALDFGDVAARLAEIDRTTLAGKRDYALLALALQTGRRLSALAGLRRTHLTIAGDTRRPSVTIAWPREKGDKRMVDALSAPVAAALVEWLCAVYSLDVAGLDDLAGDVPVWRSLARNDRRGGALSGQAIADICQKRLGTSKVHALRHTFAHGMEEVGAKVSDIQARLGHSSLQTTGRYLAALNRAENEHAGDLADLFGLTIGLTSGGSKSRPGKTGRHSRSEGRPRPNVRNSS